MGRRSGMYSTWSYKKGERMIVAACILIIFFLGAIAAGAILLTGVLDDLDLK